MGSRKRRAQIPVEVLLTEHVMEESKPKRKPATKRKAATKSKPAKKKTARKSKR